MFEQRSERPCVMQGTRTKTIRILLCVAAVLLLFGKLSALHAAERPNILYIMTDDQGYWDTGDTGNPHIDTPNMDRIAAEGVQLRRYYAAPVCSPTRAGFMTGRYYLRTGLYNTRFGGDTLGKEEITVGQLLQKAAYRTGLFGKWHLGKYPGYQPQQRGFDEFFGHYHGHIERYQFPDQVYHNGKAVDARGYVSDLFTDASIDFIEASVKQGDQPFFCALMYNAPHSPWLLDTSHYNQPEGDKLLTKYLGRKMPIREARIYALIERVDQNLGRLLAKLEELKIADNTLVVFTSDNGGVSQFWKGGMRGNKASPYEGGVRAPCFVRWPNKIPAGKVIEAQASHVDWLPTFCELAGAEVPTDRVIDGLSLVSLLKAGEGTEHQQYVYHTWDRYFPNPDKLWSISDQRWKLIGVRRGKPKPNEPPWQLVDLQADPGEKKNLAKEHPEEVTRLRKEFLRWFEEVTHGVEYAPIRIPVGHEDADSVEISPSWGVWRGKHIHYTFDGYDWDTIDRWREPGEQATWRLNVLRPGKYLVSMRYGCRPLDAGGTIRLRAGSQQLEHKVQATTTADQFDEFEIGQIELPAGNLELTAEVVSAPGKELMRLNSITLQRLE